MALQCGICLSQFKDPVCLPCGHLYCKLCISRHVNVPTNTGMTSTCPECRTSFNITIPDLTYLPEKYHPFISHAIRRVYIDESPTTDEINLLHNQLASMQARLSHKTKNEDVLLRKCESLQAAVIAHRTGEADARERVDDLEEKLEDVETEFNDYIRSTRAANNDTAEEQQRLERENRQLTRQLHQLEERLAESEARANDLERDLYLRRNRLLAVTSASALSYGSRPTSHEPAHSRLRRAVWEEDYTTISHEVDDRFWEAGRHEDNTPASVPESVSVSAVEDRLIKPLPRRLRITRSRDDDSVTLGSTKRARMRG